MAKPSTTIAIVAVALCMQPALMPRAGAAPAWRCGNVYTDQPCKGGRALDVEDRRSEADRRAADAATRRAHVQGAAMERTRLRQEKEAADRDRKAAADARRLAQAERKVAANERLAQAKIRKLDREPRKSTMTFKGG